jgi:uncharacterized FlaG/YvyC family protein
MDLEKKQLEDLEKIQKGLATKRNQLDPHSTQKTVYNPSTGDLYVSVVDKNGNIRRKVINLLGE